MGTKSQPIQAGWQLPALIIFASFLLGGFAGSMFGAFAVKESSGQLTRYLNDYIELVQSGGAIWSGASAVWHHGRWFLGCILLGFTGLGVVLLPLLVCCRGFLLAFGISCFVRFLGMVGFLPAVCLFGLPALLWVPGLFLAGVLSLTSSICLLRRRRGEVLPLREKRACWYGAAASFLLLCVCVVFECGILPVLLPLAARVLG